MAQSKNPTRQIERADDGIARSRLQIRKQNPILVSRIPLYSIEGLVMASATNALISFEDGSPTVDAETIALGLEIPAMDVQPLIRSGEITSRCEVGRDEDAGLTRLTFFMRGRRFRIVVDARGRVLRRSTIDFGQRALPPPLRT